MKQARFRFYAELNDFLAPEKRMTAFTYQFAGRQTVKHLIESAGVPHTEVDLVLVNGRSVSFSHFIEDGDFVSVYPMFEAFDIQEVSQVRPRPLRETRFVLDAHLGRLAGYLRMLGFDTLYRNDYQDSALAGISSSGRRVLLTRDRGLLKRNEVSHGYYVRETNPRCQLVEVLHRLDLVRSVAAFTRCLRCNGLLKLVSKERVAHRVPPASREQSDEYRECVDCGQLYWNGSHHRRMMRFIEQVVSAARS